MTEKMITIIHGDEERMAEVILTYYDENSDKNYVIFEFVDSKEISAAVFVEENSNEGYFLDIETEDEWQLLEEVLASYYSSLEDE
ncbi:MAG: hypothetical protein RBS76_02360 [Acholeplasmatales bacterium]|jgi:uncharacterized protein YrzB (UPF0473 family)|nr:hypothetical protein [Acholeplasmataceae bacterium]MDY0115325.1 hypothetical protein [Acholeplasmatales bacterium]MCK9233943.1 hypothetical protein [Acholeplasmataceae bacterium]MCK9288906.1 hypothetical protein [Acholeplasmataceae bacterium]MCK9427500.1 hypothetical protein [Acholeplasmataceae bacterium]